MKWWVTKRHFEMHEKLSAAVSDKRVTTNIFDGILDARVLSEDICELGVSVEKHDSGGYRAERELGM